jgi:hypothetical protein
MACPMDLQTLQRLFALWADSAQALANGDTVNTAEVRAEARAMLRDFADAVIRAHAHKIRLEAE